MGQNWFDKADARLVWKHAAEIILTCKDYKFIPLHENAGEIINDNLIMHNGILIHPLSYYGKNAVELFKITKGVHEPQEERVFQEVLKVIPDKATMVEFGSYWSFYSIWFKSLIKNGKSFLVEANEKNLNYGKHNFKINGHEGDFTCARVCRTFVEGQCVSLDSFVKDKNIDFLDIFHADIDGSEMEMLIGGENTFNNNKVGFAFISTHFDLHEKCVELLKSYNYEILHSISLTESYSFDGIIVAKSPLYDKNIPNVQLDKRISNQAIDPDQSINR